MENSWNVSYCEINLILTWPDKCVLSNATKATILAITDSKLYVPVATLSTQDNAKLLRLWKSGFKRTINWIKYQSKIQVFREWIDLLFYPLKTLQIEQYAEIVFPLWKWKIIMLWLMDETFSQPVKNSLRTYDNIRKIATGQGDDYTTRLDYLLDYFNKNYKMIAIDLSKQQPLDADSKAIPQINTTGNLKREENANTTSFIIE